MKSTSTNDFNYDSFDRLMSTFLQMSHVLIEEWHNCTTEELTHDIHSLCVKGSRLCNMIDMDLTLQQQDLTQGRKDKNKAYFLGLGDLIMPLVRLLTKDVVKLQQEGTLERPLTNDNQVDLFFLMPKLGEWVLPTAPDKENVRMAFTELPLMLSAIEKEIDYKPSFDEPWESQFIYTFRYFSMLCLLAFHFKHLALMMHKELGKEEAGHLLTRKVQAYQETEKGKEEMRHFIALLKYEYEGKKPSSEALNTERRQLVKLVPKVFQTCFMEHIDDINELAASVTTIHPMPGEDDFQALFLAIAKYQWISGKLYEQSHSACITSEPYNKVFHTNINGKPVDFNRLRKQIGQMVSMIERKNHWFCIYSVLKYRNLIKDPVATHFAEQMQSSDWFPHLPDVLRFTGETLTEYNGYLNDTSFPTWNRERYDSFRLRKGKKKWSPDLWSKFQRLCYQLDECFSG